MRFVFIVLFMAITANAKVFNIENQSSGVYLRGNYGLNNTGQNAYVRSSGSQTTFQDEPELNWGGEFGFFIPTKYVITRLGLNVIAPQKMSRIEGKNSSGTTLLFLESSIFGIFPSIHFEYLALKTSYGRGYFSIGGGYGEVRLTNKYDLTSSGTVLYGVNDYTEKASQYTYLLETSVGFEAILAHSVTINLDAGYRYSQANDLEYDEAATTLIGSKTSGNALVDSSGKKRSLDLGGAFVGIGLNFYFNY